MDVAAADALVASYVFLWVLVVVAILMLLGVARQVAVLNRRLTGVDPVLPTLKVGEPAVEIQGSALRDGAPMTLGPSFERRTVLAFVSDGCDFCATLPAKLEEMAPQFPDVDFRFVMRDPLPLESPLRHRFALDRAVVSPRAFDDWGVVGTPFGFVVGTAGKVLAKGDLIGVRRLWDTLDPTPARGQEAHTDHTEVVLQ
jgi:hypothetical protein